MKSFLNHRSKRFDLDGWALKIKGDLRPLAWTTSTTRAEARQLRHDRADIFERGADIVKVRVWVEEVAGQ